MAFFGLTALGPQNSFLDALRRKGEIEAKDTVQVLEILYRGPVPDADGALCCKYLPKKQILTENDFVTSLLAAQAYEEEHVHQVERAVSTGSEYASYEMLREYQARHVRLKDDPKTKYAKPLTASMEMGWILPEKYEPLVAPKQSCEETVYQAELIKAGVYY